MTSPLQAIFARRSISRLDGPAPSEDHLLLLLKAGAAAPDHDELRPFRFIVLRGDTKDDFGEVLERAYLRRARDAGVEPTDGQRTKERTKLGRAPLVIVVAAVRRPSDKIPWQDQLGAAFAAAQNIVLAATMLGYGSMWRTGDVAFDAEIKQALGLDVHDAIVAWLYIGNVPAGGAKPAKEPVIEDVVFEWEGPPR